MDRKISAEEIRTRVQRGAALLDQKSPDWAHTVPVNEVDMSYAETCVLGWVYGDYIAGIVATGLDTLVNLVSLNNEDIPDGHPAVLHGFDFGNNEIMDEHGRICYDEYRWLTDAWRNLIAERRASLIPQLS